MRDVVVVGAGIAGLAAAWELQRLGLAPLVLEASPRAGGVIVTERIDGFVVDGGPDAILVQKPAAVELCRELGLGERLIPTLPPRTAFVVRGGRLVSLPEASFLGLPTRVRPFVSTRLFSPLGKLRMAAEVLLPPRRAEDDESIGSFMGRRFGAEAVAYLAEPLLAGIHAGDVDRLSVRALFPRLVESEQAHGSVLRALMRAKTPRAPHGAFVSMRNGIREIVDALVTALGEGTIQYDAAATQITGSGPYRVALATGEEIQARVIVLAIPAWAAAAVLARAHGDLAGLCGEIPYVSTATVAVAVREQQIAKPLVGTGFVVPRAERKRLMAGTWVSSKWPHRAPPGHVLLRGFLGGASDPDVLALDDTELSQIAFAELAAFGGISGDPLWTRVFRWPRATPQYEVGHLARVRQIAQTLARRPGLYLTGSGYRGTGIPDGVADGRATAAAAAAFLR
jgi:protoporphyrinogen/coproporphyrinogen III oxidase